MKKLTNYSKIQIISVVLLLMLLICSILTLTIKSLFGAILFTIIMIAIGMISINTYRFGFNKKEYDIITNLSMGYSFAITIIYCIYLFLVLIHQDIHIEKLNINIEVTGIILLDIYLYAFASVAYVLGILLGLPLGSKYISRRIKNEKDKH